MRFKSCLLVLNENGSNAKKTTPHIRELKQLFGDSYTEYKLSDSDFTDKSELRRELGKLPNDSLLVLVGGDGTVSMTVNLLLGTKAVHKTTVFPLWAGNASDVAHMLNGRRRKHVKGILEHGERADSKPLDVTIEQSKTTKHSYALAYFSMGATGAVMRAIEKRDKKTNLLAEATIGTLAMFKMPRFMASHNNEQQPYYEFAFVNGSRIAKLYKTPARLTRSHVAFIRLRRKHPVLFGHLFALLTSFLKRRHPFKTHVIQLHDAVEAQIDGETIKLQPGSKVTVKPADQSYFVLSTRV